MLEPTKLVAPAEPAPTVRLPVLMSLLESPDAAAEAAAELSGGRRKQSLWQVKVDQARRNSRESSGAPMRLASENISGFRRRTRAPPPMPMPRASNEVTLPAIGVGRRVAPP